MKKPILALALVALCIVLYMASEVYATTCALPSSTTLVAPKNETSNYNTPLRLEPLPHACGDPVNDPRPKLRRTIII